MAKEKSITELRDERNQLITRSKEITAAAKAEKRMLTEDENSELSGIQTSIVDVNVEIASREAQNHQEGQRHVAGSYSFSLRKGLLQLVEGRGFTQDIADISKAGESFLMENGISPQGTQSLMLPVEARAAFTATGSSGTGSDMIDTAFLDILTPLRDRLVLASAGATVLTGLRGNIDIPAYSGSTSQWEAENDEATDGGGTFSHKIMKPKRLTSVITVSRQLLIQDTQGIEQLLRTDLIDSIATALEATILGKHVHADIKPDGLFTGYAGAAVDFTWDNVVGLETGVDLSNALLGNTKYIMHTSLFGKAKTTVKKAQGAVGFVLDQGDTMNGYQVLRTNAVAMNPAVTGGTPAPANYGIVFGNWADLLIGQWGAIDLFVDPYTKAKAASVQIIVNSYWDAIQRRGESFAKALMK
jgi:HK97 family phage major capsid protein